MGRGRRRRSAETLIPAADEDDPIHAAESAEAEGEEEDGKEFFACYLLCSLSPRHKGHTYIGFTVNPRRRIRQHNGEITSGAWRTKRKRPWEMILCIYGFPTNVNALQFEWAWQHPRESLAVRKAAESFKSLSGITNKIKIAYTMLTLPSWEKFNLTVNFFSTKYMKHTIGCPRLPKNMRVNVREMDELPCYVDGETLEEDDETDYSEACNDEEDKPLESRDAPMNQYAGDNELNERMVPEDPNGKQQSDGIVYPIDDFIQSPERTYNRYSWQLESDDAFQQARSIDSCDSTPIKRMENLIQSPERTYNGYSWRIESSDVKSIGSCYSTPIKMVNRAGVTGGVLSASSDLDSVHPNQLGTTAYSIEPSTPMSSGADINARKCDKCLSPDRDVIDLLTPSSCIAPNEDMRAAVRRQIIDLTESPSVIHL